MVFFVVVSFRYLAHGLPYAESVSACPFEDNEDPDHHPPKGKEGGRNTDTKVTTRSYHEKSH